MQPGQEITPKEKLLSKIALLIQKNRVVFLVILVLFIGSLIGYAVYSEVTKGIIAKSTLMVEQAQKDYTDWLNEKEETKKATLEEAVKSSLNTILMKYPRLYAGQRALFIRANMAYEKKEWSSAIEDYTKLAKVFPASYLAPLSLENASISYEEAGNLDKAIETYNLINQKYGQSYPAIPKVIFFLGRLYEEKKDYKQAAVQYNNLIDNYAASSWTKLARNRIIYLKAKGDIAS
ncbi:MAG: tetratricopeptide repeat protein [Spirochaetota bacterium]